MRDLLEDVPAACSISTSLSWRGLSKIVLLKYSPNVSQTRGWTLYCAILVFTSISCLPRSIGITPKSADVTADTQTQEKVCIPSSHHGQPAQMSLSSSHHDLYLVAAFQHSHRRVCEHGR